MELSVFYEVSVPHAPHGVTDGTHFGFTSLLQFSCWVPGKVS